MNTIRFVLKRHLVQSIFMGMLAILLLRAGGANIALALSCGQWNVVSTVAQGYFTDVTAVPGKPDDIWAVGYYSGTAARQTLIEHWNGKEWKTVTSPNIGRLTGIAAVSANDIWAVGGQFLHWNGKKWSIVPDPSNGALGITALTSNDAWAVGGNNIIDHWDGTQWSVIPTASTGGCAVGAYDVVAISSNDVWMVGEQIQDCGVAVTAFSEHWDGTQWTIVDVPGPGRNSLFYSFRAVAATSSNNVWAVGLTQQHGVNVPLTERWDGTQWSVALQTNVGALDGITTTSAGNFWAVGYNPDSLSAPPLAEFYC